MFDEFGSFVAAGFRDSIIEAIFSALITVTILLLVALFSGRWLQSVSVGGLTLNFAVRESRKAYKYRNQRPPSRSSLERSLRPLRGNWQVLWVDDRPENNRREMEALSALGFQFRLARTNEEAEQLLKSQFFHLVISDIGRSDGSTGLDVELLAREHAEGIPIVFYVGDTTGPSTERGSPVVSVPRALYAQIRKSLLR